MAADTGRNEYRCEECTNRRTELCRLCRFIKKTNGEETRPSLYVRETAAGATNEILAEVADYVKARLAQGRSIPIYIIDFYNKQIEKCEPNK